MAKIYSSILFVAILGSTSLVHALTFQTSNGGAKVSCDDCRKAGAGWIGCYNKAPQSSHMVCAGHRAVLNLCEKQKPCDRMVKDEASDAFSPFLD